MPKAILRAFALCLALAAAGAGSAEVPFYPTVLDTGTGLFAGPDALTPAAQCAYCHPDQHEQWRGSMHANAFLDPFFQAVWREAARELGSPGDRQCAGCHTPIGAANQQVWIRASGEILIHPLGEEGVSCDFCHSVEQVTLLEPGGKPGEAGLRLDPGGPKRGPFADAFSTFHETAYSELHTRSEFCGACHNVFHPTADAPVARTYDEWRRSIYARSEIHCQDCHMVGPAEAAQAARTLEKPVLEGSTSTFGTTRAPFFEHRFTGANSTVPSLLGHRRHAAEAVERLKSAAEVRVSAGGPAVPGNELTVEVRVRNVGAGHNLPTSMGELRQMWLHVVLEDAGQGGGTLWESGGLDAAGRLGADARSFGLRTVDARGEPTWKPWKIARVEDDRSIPARAQALEEYRVPVPEGAKGPLRVRARLLYRSFPPEVAVEYLGARGRHVPVVEMAEASAELSVALRRGP